MIHESCEQRIRDIVIKCGKVIRHLRGLAEDQDLTTMHNEAAILLGLPQLPSYSQEDIALPYVHPATVGDQANGRLFLDCPKCNQKTMVIYGLCPSCRDSESGKYKTMLQCSKCNFKEKLEDPLVTWLERLGVNFEMQTKASLGIKTVTDDGVK